MNECLVLNPEQGTTIQFEEADGGFVWGGFWTEFEEAGQFKFIKGLIVYEGVSTNGREYGFEEMDNLAKTAIGCPIYYGSDPDTEKHLKGPAYTVGRVVKAWVDKAKKGVRIVGKIWNTRLFPDLLSRVRKGWGYSVGGKAKNFIWKGLTKLGKPWIKLIGTALNHLQLLEPQTPLGMPDARVEEIFEETMQPSALRLFEVEDEVEITLRIPSSFSGTVNIETI